MSAIRRAVELELGERVGGLVNEVLDQVRRGELPPHVARVMLDRLLPSAPPRAVDLGCRTCGARRTSGAPAGCSPRR
jgi:hypothetical protein